jgi:hypothetical protein
VVYGGLVASTFEAVLVGPASVGRLHAADLPQKDNLCGCFWASIALRAAGIEGADGEPLDQDRVALESGTVLPLADPAGSVPPGESPRLDYRLALPVTAEAGASGTAATVLAEAIERLSEGRLEVLPVAGPWTADSVLGLARAVRESSSTAFLVANVQTGRFWGTRPDPPELLDYLAGGSPTPPAPEWDVGHFVNLAGIVTVGERSLVVVRDSYRSLGWEGHHLQPADAFAAALERGDGREGGVLCVTPAADAEALGERLSGDGFQLRHWDNGTPARVTPTGS